MDLDIFMKDDKRYAVMNNIDRYLVEFAHDCAWVVAAMDGKEAANRFYNEAIEPLRVVNPE